MVPLLIFYSALVDRDKCKVKSFSSSHSHTCGMQAGKHIFCMNIWGWSEWKPNVFHDIHTFLFWATIFCTWTRAVCSYHQGEGRDNGTLSVTLVFLLKSICNQDVDNMNISIVDNVSTCLLMLSGQTCHVIKQADLNFFFPPNISHHHVADEFHQDMES